MKRILTIILCLILCFCFMSCSKNDSLKSQDSETEQVSEKKELDDKELAEIVAKSLGVPDKESIDYGVSKELYYFEGADCYYKNITFNENDEIVARASVDPYTGELLKNIIKYLGSN